MNLAPMDCLSSLKDSMLRSIRYSPMNLAPMDCLSSLKDSMLRSIRYSTSMGKHALYTILQVDSVGATRSDSWKFRTASWVWKMVF